MHSHEVSTASDEAVIQAAQPHVVVLMHVVVEGHVIHIPELTQWTHIDVQYLVLAIVDVMGTTPQSPLGVQAPQPHDVGMSEAVLVIIRHELGIQTFHPYHDPLYGRVLPVNPLARKEVCGILVFQLSS